MTIFVIMGDQLCDVGASCGPLMDVILFRNNHNYHNNFIIPSASETQHFHKKPAIHLEEDMFDIFKQFGSVSELKDILKEDPSYITKIQGLHNLRKTVSPVGRSIKSVLLRMFSRNKREKDKQENFILTRPAIYESLSDDI